MNAVTRILVVHDSPLLRDCLTSVLSDDGLQAISFDRQFDDLDEFLTTTQPDVVIVDLALSQISAKDLISTTHRILPEVAVVALVSDFVERDVVDAVTAGAMVCVPESASLDELRVAIDHAIQGESYCSPRIANTVLAQLSEVVRSVDWKTRAEEAILTTREFEVLRLIAESNFSNKQIARALCVSLYTVKNHVHNILEKLSVEDRHAAVAFARDRAWI